MQSTLCMRRDNPILNIQILSVSVRPTNSLIHSLTQALTLAKRIWVVGADRIWQKRLSSAFSFQPAATPLAADAGRIYWL